MSQMGKEQHRDPLSMLTESRTKAGLGVGERDAGAAQVGAICHT